MTKEQQEEALLKHSPVLYDMIVSLSLNDKFMSELHDDDYSIKEALMVAYAIVEANYVAVGKDVSKMSLELCADALKIYLSTFYDAHKEEISEMLVRLINKAIASVVELYITKHL